MKVLLRTDVDGLGRTGDIVDVARGYARNFLVPEGLAVAAIGGIAAQAEAMQRKRDLRSVAERADAERVAGRIAGVVLQVTAKASEEGRLFGSVGTAEVVEALAAQVGLEVDRRQVHGEIAKDVGVHEFTVQLHPEVAVPVDVEVRAED
ncbi:MAG TPA: 50S ribosomal protein L9 [Acidimicrobiia bacterium]|nr:50S ribosomal protein L9 [Acidimicrobiales bacterium]RUA26885.1 MAG: 50S ribosomal protein L9 [Actinomycetota bacterium]HBL08283.1 50S ribosomal protein L9 [Acidimicrobiaceae bacterium]HIM66468.1 50S ribosomal protein L9 [Acidimicrobiia bacterium]HIM84199.1 50S ribosomal protein L9 [Acidimicrobiia bacterium]